MFLSQKLAGANRNPNPNYDNSYAGTVLLLGLENGTDEGPSALVGALTGAASFSNLTSKFGVNSLLLPAYTGNNGFSFTPANAIFNWMASDYTAEVWHQPANIGQVGFAHIMNFESSSSSFTPNPGLWTSGTGMYLRNANSVDMIPSFVHGMVNGLWYHILVQRRGGTWYVYINGVLKSSGAATVTNESKFFHIGGSATVVNASVGYFNEMRCSNKARVTGNFTPPIAKFPRS